MVERVKRDNIEEVILATSATVEGQTTAFYIQNSLKKTKAKITRLAQGLPVGGEIETLDDGTLFSAFKNRSEINSILISFFFLFCLNVEEALYSLMVVLFL